jgi:hypothetical protein
VLQLSSRDGKSSVLIQMDATINRTKAPETASLIFEHYGNEYFFAQAWMPDSDGLSAPKSRADRIRTQLAGAKARTEMVALRNR